MRALRPILHNPLTQTAICWLVASYIRLVWRTGQWTILGAELPNALQREERPFIAAFWHGRLAMMPFSLGAEKTGIHVMISTHRDGRLISRAVEYLGVTTVAGSTSKGGVNAARQAIRILKNNKILAITPDGPRGPRMRASEGVVALARHTGAPVFPVSYSTSRRKVFGSWDRFVLPLPFSRGYFVWGPAVTVDTKAGPEAMEAARHKVESALNATTAEADQLCGQPTIQPADAVPLAKVSR